MLNEKTAFHLYPSNPEKVLLELGKETVLKILNNMLLIRNFETRGESAYQHGKIGGFFHSYIGQEAIQTAAVQAFGSKNWWVTTYRCHALALLLGANPHELMAELYGKITGNAKGRGGSMHFYAERLLGGFGIVGGQIPIATGAAFTLKYKEIKDELSICFLGDGAVAQGSFHEALNLASLWNLPCVFIIENNKWGMGTSVEKAVCVPRLAEDKAPGYNMKAYTVNGQDFFACYDCFKEVKKQVLETNRPVLIEAITERFKGHSISDPGLYRSKEQLKEILGNDPIQFFVKPLIEKHFLDREIMKKMDKEQKEIVLEAMKFAEESPWPNPTDLGKDVFAP